MWAFKYQYEGSRNQVPKYQTFIMSNQSLYKWWYEDLSEPFESRINFQMRCCRFLTTTGLLFIFTYLVLSPEDAFF